ncbi:MAG: Xaa-Pro peptidase family protein [Planctomycetaceae bacterium]|jgi:Xaa-Pro aminopeptidase|nr:Xaa-Pro peptidase family protein [Planctomycetaceae bacterium]
MSNRFQLRRNNLRSLLKKEGINAVLVTNFVNVSYLTGFSGDDSYLLLAGNEEILLSDFRYEEQIAGECPDVSAFIRSGSEPMEQAVKKLLKGNRPLAVEADSMTLAVQGKFAEALDGRTFVPLSGLVEKLRMVKDKWEIEEMKKAAKAAKRAFETAKAALRAEQTEIDVRNHLETQMKLFGAEGTSFPSIVAAGPWAARCHAVPGGRRVGDGELLLIDWGAVVNKYMSDNTRTLITAPKPSAKLRKIYDIVLKAHKAAIEAVAPGKICSDIDAVARGIITDAGYGRFFGHGLGHSLGREIHENPRFNTVSSHILEPGNVMTVEPGIYLPGWGGIRIEDEVLVTKTGYEILTPNLPKEFEEMIVDVF